jgi:hypothetical protein
MDGESRPSLAQTHTVFSPQSLSLLVLLTAILLLVILTMVLVMPIIANWLFS